MAEDGFGERGSNAPKDLVVRFWTLVVLAKFGIMLVGVGIPIVVFTEYWVVGVALILIGMVIGFRWLQVYRAAQAR